MTHLPTAWSQTLLRPMPRRDFLCRMAALSGLAMTRADVAFGAIEQGFRFARIKGDFDWDTDFAGVGLSGSSDLLFLERLANSSTILTQREEIAFEADSPSLFESPFLVVHSHLPIAFNQDEMANLRLAVERGAFLFIEDCGGGPAWEQSARAFCKQLLPEKRLEALDDSHPVLHSCFDLPANVAGDKATTEPLEGIAIDNRLAVLFSRTDFHCAWEGHACRPGGEPQRDNAFRFGINLVTYALTH